MSAAIEVLDAVIAGAPAERVLTRWAREHRFAGSKDRAAIRDLVYDILRTRASSRWFSGAPVESGRALLIGNIARDNVAFEDFFDGTAHAPAPVTAAEAEAVRQDLSGAAFDALYDLPAFLEEDLRAGLGDGLADVSTVLRSRAPVDLRINTLSCDLSQAREALAQDGVETEPVPDVATALRVTANPRRVTGSRAYRDGLVELQDAASQAVARHVGAQPGEMVLDLCAGGGGKTLAMAADMRGTGVLKAFDANRDRMRDIPVRASRAGVEVEMLDDASVDALTGRCDRVLADVPCSGSGAWRRDPDQKWRIGPADMIRLAQLQQQILTRALGLVRPGGRLVFATCSILRSENEAQADWLGATGRACEITRRRYRPGEPGDGFFCAEFTIT